MKTLDRIVALLFVLFGALHSQASPVFHGHYDLDGMWFLSFGLMLAFVGFMNLTRSLSPNVATQRFAILANGLALAFVSGLVPLLSLRHNPQVVATIVALAAAMLFSLLRREARPRDSRP